MSAWPWPSSDVTGSVIPAFVKALHAVEDVTRNKRAAIDLKAGGKVNYSYADLDAVLEQVKPVLAANDLAITTPATSSGVYAVIMHTSGEWLSFPALEFKPTQTTPQGQGSALTYGRRYSVLGVLNIATEDDDGAAASAPPPKPVKTAAEREAEKVRKSLAALSSDGRKAFRAYRGERGVEVADLTGDADWREDVSNWISEWEHDHKPEAVPA